jgi:hypothetical protein
MQIDTATGALVSNEIWPSAVSEWGAQVYDAETDTILVQSDIGWVKLFLGRGGGQGDSLSAIVADLCERAGLGLADIEAAELTDTVPGYVIARQTRVRSAIEPLAAAYFFDGVESDDVLRFRKRGGAPVATIPQPDLLPLEDETKEAWRERRTQEVELPERVSVLYMDSGSDYTQGTQFAKRASLPVPTMHARSQTSLDLPIALDATTAASSVRGSPGSMSGRISSSRSRRSRRRRRPTSRATSPTAARVSLPKSSPAPRQRS